MNFQFQLPVNLLFGRGRIGEIGAQAALYGKRALLVTGGGSARKSGLLDRVAGSLKAAGVEPVLFEGVPQNPLTATAEKGVRAFLENACDVVVGVGGGSVLDTSKAIAFAAVNEGDISEYIYGRKQASGAFPIILANTTAGTGSEGNCFAVLTNPETLDKKSLKTPYTFAKVSIIDPELMTTMPPRVVASTVFDAFAHCHESFVSRRAQPLNEIMALHAIKLIGENARRVYRDPSDVEAWEPIALSSTIGGMSINLAGVGLPHAMEHPASGLRNVVHGQGLAALTPAVMEWNLRHSAATEKYERLARALGGHTAADAVELVRALLADLGLDAGLSEIGVKREDIPWMCENSFRIMKANIDGNPCEVSFEEMASIYASCL